MMYIRIKVRTLLITTAVTAVIIIGGFCLQDEAL